MSRLSLCLGSPSCDSEPEAAIFPGTTLCLCLLQLSQNPFESQVLGELIVFVSTHAHTNTQTHRETEGKTAKQNAPFIFPLKPSRFILQ